MSEEQLKTADAGAAKEEEEAVEEISEEDLGGVAGGGGNYGLASNRSAVRSDHPGGVM